MIDNTSGGNPETSSVDVVPVNAGAMQDLAERYTAYRQTMDREYYDPVHAMQLTGQVMASVREIVVNGHPTTTPETTNEEEPPQ